MNNLWIFKKTVIIMDFTEREREREREREIWSEMPDIFRLTLLTVGYMNY